MSGQCPHCAHEAGRLNFGVGINDLGCGPALLLGWLIAAVVVLWLSMIVEHRRIDALEKAAKTPATARPAP